MSDGAITTDAARDLIMNHQFGPQSGARPARRPSGRRMGGLSGGLMGGLIGLASLAGLQACGNAGPSEAGESAVGESAAAQTVAVDTKPAAPTTNDPALSASGAGIAGQWFVSAANPYAVEAGAEILRRGGSAVDAAITVQAVLGLVEPQSSGLGGGAFLIHFNPATGRLLAYDGRETAPASATPERFLTADGEPMNYYDAVAGGLSIGVPGAVAMLGLAHERHGKLPWAELLEPARALAEEGFEVSPRLHELLGRIPRLKQMPAAAAYFYDEDGAPLAAGHRLKNPAYAKTLGILMEKGAAGFYTGEIAEAIVTAANAAPNPSGMTLQDLQDYRPVVRAPVCGPYRYLEICSMGPPSSGGVTLLQILGLLDGFDIAGAGAGSVEALHLILEASRLAYADRDQYLADQDDSSISIEDLVAGLLNPAYIEARAEQILAGQRLASVAAGQPGDYPLPDGNMPGAFPDFGADASAEPPSTSHFSIVDGAGRVVSMTTTVEFAFGSHQMAAGMILNNQLTDFSFRPVRDGKPVANAVAPGKRPRSSMTPVIAFNEDGDLWGAIGSPGGPAIIGYVAKTLIALVDWDMPLQEAIDYPNIVIPRGTATVEEGGFDDQVKAGLNALGHELAERALTSGLHGFVVTEDGFDGGADPRREGTWASGRVAPETVSDEAGDSTTADAP